jgi:hypothetical protein
MSLALAIVAVMGDIVAVEKNGLNTHFKFKYQAWDDVLPAVKSACVTHGLAIVPEVKEVIRGDKKVTVMMNYHLLSGDQSMVVSYAGEALDNDDKAIQKAITSATKYFYLKTFMIPINGEEDPDGSDAKVKPNQITSQDAARALKKKAADRWTQLGGTKEQWTQLADSLKSVGSVILVESFVMDTFQEGVNDLQGIYDYATSAFKLNAPFIIGGITS